MSEQNKSGLIRTGINKARNVAATVGAAGTVALATATPAFASVDVSGAVGAFNAAADSIGLIGVAMVAAAGAGIVYRWVTAFMVK